MNPADHPADSELLAYLDESLSVDRSAAIEQLLRIDPVLRKRIAVLLEQRDQGGHSIGEIWRRHRLSCLSREQLAEYSRGAVNPDLAAYIDFHLYEIGCRFCQANLDDLINLMKQKGQRRVQQRYFESSADMLRSQRVRPNG